MWELRLENALLRLFLQAEAEGRRDIAEHLMRALDAFYAGPDTTKTGPSSIRNGHAVAAKQCSPPEAAGVPQEDGSAERDASSAD